MFLSVCYSSFSLQGWYYHLLCTLKPPSNATVHYLGNSLLWGTVVMWVTQNGLCPCFLYVDEQNRTNLGQGHILVTDKTGLSLKFRLAPVQRADSDDKRGGYHGSPCRRRSQHGLRGWPGVPVTQREDLIRQQM